MHLEQLELLKSGRNLLAFSGGVDSTALYFLLRDFGVCFDVAMVDYGVRKQSILEVSRARSLCFLDSKKFFLHNAQKITKDFENTARAVRYEFFEQILAQGYTNLILAHQLNDALEWLLMQLTRGSNLQGMLLLNTYTKQSANKNLSYKIIRPLINVPKFRLLEYLKENGIFYFLDSSNDDTNFRRNYFRKHFANALVSEFQSGITLSLQNLRNSSNATLLEQIKRLDIAECGSFCIFSVIDFLLLEQIDRACKLCGILLKKGEKDEIKKHLNTPFSLVFQHKISIEREKDLIFIAKLNAKLKPKIPKDKKEFYRKIGIPKKFRIAIEIARNIKKDREILDIILILKDRHEKSYVN